MMMMITVADTHIIEFNEFLSQTGDPSHLPLEPTLDLHVKLNTTDFHWAFDFTNVTSTYHVVCQQRQSLY